MNSRREEGSSSYPPPPLTASRIYIGNKAKEILATRDVTGIAKLVTNLCYAKETEESSSPKHLCKSFTNHFPNILAVKLMQVYRFDSLSAKIRSFSLSLLDSLLLDLEVSGIGLKTESLKDIKTHLNDCFLFQQTSDHDFKHLSRIVSRVSDDFFINFIPWEELCAYILSLNDLKALLIFSELPLVLEEELLMPLLENDLHLKIAKELLNLNPDFNEEEWCLALEAGFSLIIQLGNWERKDLVWDLVYVNVHRREIVVRRGFVKVAKKVCREAMRFREPEYEVVSRLALMLKRISGVGEFTEMAAKMIHEVLERYYMGGQGLDFCFGKQNPRLKICNWFL